MCALFFAVKDSAVSFRRKLMDDDDDRARRGTAGLTLIV
jgi:hypothetical protein